jgi:hypothetical protein
MGSDSKVRRVLHVRFTMPNADAAHVAAMVKAAAPFYQAFGGDIRMRLLQNADDPAKFTHEIEYDTPEAFEKDRQNVASDARVQVYLQTWRAMFPGAVEVDVYKEI